LTKVLVTGGAGFIGSNLVDLLLQQDYEVRVIDNLSTGKIKNVPKGVEFIKGDITDENIIKTSLKDIEIVYHFAAQASVVISMKNPILDAEVNTLATLKLLKESLNSNVDHFLFASTGGAIYGDSTNLPFSESQNEDPISVYGTSKLAAEKYIQFYEKQGLKSSILRFANVYGPRQDPLGEAGVISIFLGNILNNKPLIVYGDGTSSRDYIFVKDVAKVAENISKKPTSKPINVGTGKEITINELIGTIRSVTKREFEVIYGDERIGDVKNSYLECSNLKKHIGYIPSTTLTEGLEEVWKWMKSKEE